MELLRIAKQEDIPNFYQLWKLCFGDSDDFCDWFFRNRFAPEYSVCLQNADGFASCMQAFPYMVWIRGKKIPGAMMCGVCTHPKERKKGYMGKVFSYDMQVLHQKGIAVAVHTPAVLPSYFSFGHYPVADARYLTAQAIPKGFRKREHSILLEGTGYKKAYACYESHASKYSGMICRTEADFVRKMEDYAADGGRCMADSQQVQAYVCYYQTEEALTCVEAVGEETALQEVLEGLFAEAAGLSLSVKLPPKSRLTFPFAQSEVKQKGVMGLVNIALLLQKLGLDAKATFMVTDSVIEQNNGCFTLNGSISSNPPAFAIPSGRLLPVLVGYQTLEEQKEWITIYDMDGFLEIQNKLPRMDCYIIDEY